MQVKKRKGEIPLMSRKRGKLGTTHYTEGAAQKKRRIVIKFSLPALDPTIAAGFSAGFVASEIRKSICLEKNEALICPTHHKLVVYLRRLLPSIYFKAMEYRAKGSRSR